ncbi:DEAD/DEAH box helicase family protein [Acinetobacter seifertii]|uniref:EcoAI/FtnUII family type I restriction enzme subunit R n=1 Tax=Acinetobacter seifertii TaxID=1530123 RepID=UPI00168ACABD|nr:DEAD/DEAH box helicase family protein [Acinetobacter seifertii]QNX20836.1 DEAD/DEAH box helicase family protein [Acinetobacter seifertii]QNX38453.1 DEAD/DEAH box helicase family protein [Acinetobacter seifertii]QNX97976.1 DEAD/DEAH box helicase family protein [Acinetobacter seifertii]QNY01690.1 DEAD/DEAH box helicase family protein [Acinetobacter seifertii]
MSKKQLSERDICTKFITPALEQSGWDIATQIREEFPITKGRIVVRGKLHTRAKLKRADYVLFYKPNIPIAVIEAKDNNHGLGDGIQQGLDYAEMLQVPFVFSSNGDGFLFHNKISQDGVIERELALHEFPSAEKLWHCWAEHKGLSQKQNELVTQDYFSDGSNKIPRYYQLLAINKTIEAIVKGQNRILLVMATGTGKTFTAFQIIWRLWRSKAKKRILFLADRNILVDQTMNNDFKPFGSAMTKIQKRQVNKSYEIYLSLYQAVTGNEEEKNIYKQFSSDFFDLIIIDECHRGSAAADSAWRDILEYFSSATQIGLTATPKETKEVSNIDYFSEPIYTYSLRQGIDDGFLAPYKVVRIDLDRDLIGWRPDKGMIDKHGNEIEDRIYNQKDFDKTLVLEQRTDLVAKKITEFLKQTNRFDKTIVFCENIDHAARMRQALVNENADLVAQNSKYIMRITGDNEEGKAELDNFIFPESKYPVIATTSKLMTTGVDAQTCKLIVLDQRIQSITEFKQIIGRGTRINEDYDKYYFTIIDFKKATELFADPDFDGDPIQVSELSGSGSPIPPDFSLDEGVGDVGDIDLEYSMTDSDHNGGYINESNQYEDGVVRRYVVANVSVKVTAERVQYFDANGKLITESLKDYTRKAITKEFATLDDFLRRWSCAEKKQAIIEELAEHGVFFEALADEVGGKSGKTFDPFDLVCHVAWDMPPLTRRERAEQVKKRNYFTQYGEQARKVMEALLDKYADEGVTQIEETQVLTIAPFTRFGTPLEIIHTFGGLKQYQQAVNELEQALYNTEKSSA